MSNEPRPPATAPAVGGSFDEIVLPHLQAAHRLARCLLRNEHDAEDVVQEASLRAFRYFRTFTGGSGRAWFLRIVRNTCYSWSGSGFPAPAAPFDEQRHSSRRSVVLREVEGLSYRELADVMGVPMGTVMSRLSRARQAFRDVLDDQLKQWGAATTAAPRGPEANAVLV
jgi:RNA polymerase sigma-70 factor (ECF subfamily)